MNGCLVNIANNMSELDGNHTHAGTVMIDTSFVASDTVDNDIFALNDVKKK